MIRLRVSSPLAPTGLPNGIGGVATNIDHLWHFERLA
jgi:hypothetical protein